MLLRQAFHAGASINIDVESVMAVTSFLLKILNAADASNSNKENLRPPRRFESFPYCRFKKVQFLRWKLAVLIWRVSKEFQGNRVELARWAEELCMKANSYSTYEEAVDDYLVKLNALMQLPYIAIPIASRNSENMNSESFVRLAEEIADISASMILLARKYQSDPDPLIHEGLCSHFIDQATTELLLEGGLLQVIREEKTGTPSSAAIQATHSAALREAVNAAGKSMAFPVIQGLATGVSYRITETSNVAEATAAFKIAFNCTAGSISRRVQELGSDITIDLVAETEWAAVIDGASSLQSPVEHFFESIKKSDETLASRAAFAAGRMLLNAYEKIVILVDRSVELEAREKIGEWLERIKRTGKIELFGNLVENLYGLDGLARSIERNLEGTTASPELINCASDLIKTHSDKFIILTGRMRKLEDAIRIGKLIQLPQLLPMIVSLQVELLTALVYAGCDYINRCEKGGWIWKQ
jgi:hypothetical protein